MDIYTGPEQRTSETYMIPVSGPNPHLTYVPQLEEVDYMASEVAPEYIYDQGLYYPAPNYFGYYCPAGFESPGEWEDQSRFFGVDGQDLNYSGMQTEGLPYVYYAPTYGYAQSPYNPYNPYIPGAVMGLDGPYIGTHQQYVTNPPYPTPESSPAYIPVLVQPSADIVPSSNHDPPLFGTGSSMLSRHSNAAKYTPNAQRSGFGNLTTETSRSSQNTARLSEGSLINVPPTVQSHGAQIRNSSGSVQAPHHFSNGRVPTIQNPSKITPSSNDSFPQFGPNIRGWATVDKFRPRLQYQEGADVLGEQNKGPRTNRSKGQWAPVDGAHQTKSGANNAQQIVISSDQYNRDDFPVNYQNAKFFVIKSYSEDDVHKSIKYNVWSSTANGNKRLDSAYQDAQRVSLGQSRNCPIFLFFSVNASGQFCGVAEMIGPVDFDKDMDFWQQDKWTGSFPVKWHIVKDVGNTSFRHIILENNENKPVTNSRDTQEIPYLPGINMLNIFKGATLKTSIIDDFMFYEERERIMQEEKARLLGRNYDSARFLPAVVPVKKNDSATTPNPPKADEKECNGTSSEPSKFNEKQLSGTSNGSVDQSPSPTGKPPNDAVDHHPSRTGGKPSTVSVDQPPSKPREEPTSIEVRSPTANRNLNKLKDCTSDQSTDQPPSKMREESTITDIRPPTANRNPSKLKDPKRTSDQPADQLPSKPREESTSTEVRPPTANRNQSKPKDQYRTSDQPADQLPSKPREESTSTEVRPPTANRNPSKPKDPNHNSDQPTDQPPSKPREESTSTDVRPRTANRNPSKLKDKSFKQDPAVDTIDSKVGEASGSGVVAADSSPIDVVTVGSMSIRVKGLGESSSSSNSVITVGTIPIEPKSLKHNKQGATAGSRPNQK